jgi:hypothetical protein
MTTMTIHLAVLALLFSRCGVSAQQPSIADKNKIDVLEAERERLTRKIAEIDAELAKLRGKTAKNPSDVISISGFLGISADFKVYAASKADWKTDSLEPTVKLFELETGKQVTSPTWDRDWRRARTAAFADNVVAVVAVGLNEWQTAVKVFSRKTMELEQNVRSEDRNEINDAALLAEGNFLAITEMRPKKGYHLILRDLQRKKTTAELNLEDKNALKFGFGRGYCCLAVTGNRVAAYASHTDEITLAQVIRPLRRTNLRWENSA